MGMKEKFEHAAEGLAGKAKGIFGKATGDRDMQAEGSLALDESGKFLALKVASVANLGAYMAGAGGGVQTYQYYHLQGTVYAIPAISLRIAAVLTNTAPIGAVLLRTATTWSAIAGMRYTVPCRWTY